MNPRTHRALLRWLRREAAIGGGPPELSLHQLRDDGPAELVMSLGPTSPTAQSAELLLEEARAQVDPAGGPGWFELECRRTSGEGARLRFAVAAKPLDERRR